MVYSLRYKVNLAFLALFSVLSLTGLGCRQTTVTSDTPLVMWGLWQDSKDLKPIIDAYKEQTGTQVEYRKMASVAEYEKKLLSALAEGRGPDIFVIHHTWVETKRPLLGVAPKKVIDERALREEFVDVVADDLVRDGQVYALPLSVDTLALYYNRDLLSGTGVARPPQTWNEFQQVVGRVATISRLGVIERSAAAMGTAANISRAGDIIQLLFLQSGLAISDDKRVVSLSNDEGARALTFYTDFANKSKKVFTWDLQQDFSIDAFVEGETAMMMSYSYSLPTVRAKNPRLRLGIAAAPQVADSKVVNFASYWPYAVSNKSAAPDAAWSFLRFMTNTENAAAINRGLQTPPARRDEVAAVARDPVMGVFAEQSLTAVTWPRGDVVAIDAILATMIDDVITGVGNVQESLSRAQDQLNQAQPQAEPAGAAPVNQPGGGFFNVL